MHRWRNLLRENSLAAKTRWPTETNKSSMRALKLLTRSYRFSVAYGDLLLLENGWYVTHTGLLTNGPSQSMCGNACRTSDRIFGTICSTMGIPSHSLQIIDCKGFVGYGDADPSNVSPLVHGAEMRVAETRAVNRALRKAYGIGICSVEEIGSFAEPASSSRESKKLPSQPVNGNYGGPKVRDRLCQLIRQHQLDATLVKSYAIDFCGTKTLREASREQVENFVAHLADWAEKDRNALLCQLNSYLGSKEGAA